MQTFYNFLLYPFIEFVKLYKHGFSIMSKESKSLWIIAVVKLFIMFGILKMFFFKDFLKTNFESNEQRIEYLQNTLTKIKK
ncbi:hypothetical protein SDC9_00863 [bioreactor metagenome]|uniref:DUF4492 domain-containing protein n=1 Tax=bioreactor metagenome TaxID=1076179 RepID=A0A644SP41_9ZZZZ